MGMLRYELTINVPSKQFSASLSLSHSSYAKRRLIRSTRKMIYTPLALTYLALFANLNVLSFLEIKLKGDNFFA